MPNPLSLVARMLDKKAMPVLKKSNVTKASERHSSMLLTASERKDVLGDLEATVAELRDFRERGEWIEDDQKLAQTGFLIIRYEIRLAGILADEVGLYGQYMTERRVRILKDFIELLKPDLFDPKVS